MESYEYCVGYGGNIFFKLLSSPFVLFSHKNNEGFLVVNLLNEYDDEEVDALLFVGKKKYFIEEGNKKIKLKKGKYDIKILSDEMLPIQEKLEIKSESTTVKIFYLTPLYKKYNLNLKVLDFKTKKPLQVKIQPSSGKNYYDIEYDSLNDIFTISGKEGICTLYIFPDDKHIPLTKIVTLENGDTTIKNIFILEENLTKNYYSIKFKKNGSILEKNSFEELSKIITILKDYPDVKITIKSFTDDSGKAKDNLILTEKRCLAVREFLVENGISKERIFIKGFGETMNLYDNETKENREKNRRIEISFF